MRKKIIIIEDEVIIAENLRRILVKLGYDVIAVANTYSEGVIAINNFTPDLYLLDINLKEEENNGIKLANLINENNNKPIIYVTSNADSKTINKAKYTCPSSYIIKPFDKQTIYSTIEVALHNHETKHGGLTIRHKGDLTNISFKDIIFLQANSVYVEIFTEVGSYMHRSSMTELTKILPSYFIQVHRSYIVNVQFVSSFNSMEISINSTRIPIGRTYKSDLLKHLPS